MQRDYLGLSDLPLRSRVPFARVPNLNCRLPQRLPRVFFLAQPVEFIQGSNFIRPRKGTPSYVLLEFRLTTFEFGAIAKEDIEWKPQKP